MKSFIIIVVSALAVFMALAIAQERDVFLPLIGITSSAPEMVTPATPPEIETTLRTFLAVMSHLYGSGGDPRFAERLPAGNEVVDEILADITYLEHNRRIQEMSLVNLQINSINSPTGGYAQVNATEYWVIRTRWDDKDGESDPARSEVHTVDYRLKVEGGEWRVIGWEHAPVVAGGDDRTNELESQG